VRRSPAAALALAAACAGVPAGPGGWAFPASFDANQVVVAEARDGAGTWELVASLRRRGADYEVTLFDPVFGAPVLAASLRDGRASEQVLAPAGIRAGDGERLVETLREIYGQRYPAESGGATGAETLRQRTTLAAISGGTGCRFPATIEIRPRAGPVERLEVRTIEVRCDTQ